MRNHCQPVGIGHLEGVSNSKGMSAPALKLQSCLGGTAPHTYSLTVRTGRGRL